MPIIDAGQSSSGIITPAKPCRLLLPFSGRPDEATRQQPFRDEQFPDKKGENKNMASLK
jgi:hypothetical protein